MHGAIGMGSGDKLNKYITCSEVLGRRSYVLTIALSGR